MKTKKWIIAALAAAALYPMAGCRTASHADAQATAQTIDGIATGMRWSDINRLLEQKGLPLEAFASSSDVWVVYPATDGKVWLGFGLNALEEDARERVVRTLRRADRNHYLPISPDEIYSRSKLRTLRVEPNNP